MKILVERIEAAPTQLDFEASARWLQDRLDGDADLPEGFSEALSVSVSAHRVGEDLILEGRAEGGAPLVCGRCLTRYRAPIRESFRLLLEPAGARVPADPEGAAALAKEGLYLSDELETGWYQGSELHLDRFVQELVALALPLQPVCREECLGLCPRCGVDRNQESCQCSEQRPESPFAVLEGLKETLAGKTTAKAGSRAGPRSEKGRGPVGNDGPGSEGNES